MGPQAGMHWKHLTLTDRRNLEKYLREGMSKTECARVLRVHRNTIYDEIRRGKCVQLNYEGEFVEVYCADVAERKYRENLAAKGPREKIGNDRALADYVSEKIIKEKKSPAVIAGLLQKDNAPKFSCTISEKTIYNYIEKGIFWGVGKKQLPRKGKHPRKYKRTVTVKMAPAGESIENRPKEVNDRLVPFHWEGDCILGPISTRACLLALTERMTRFEIIIWLPRHTAAEVLKAFDALEQRLGKEMFAACFQSITFDNGSEFRNCKGIEASIYGGKRTKAYYCHPYSSWERGSNENQNGFIRREFPKNTNFERVTPEDVARVQDWVNNYPRKMFAWNSSAELFQVLLAA